MPNENMPNEKKDSPLPPYDPNNVFAKIIRGDLPATIVFQNTYTLAFKDIHPQAKVHVIVIPKGAYINAYDFYAHASAEEILSYYQAIKHLVTQLELLKDGFRTIANTGTYAGQDVPHFHTHLLGGNPLGPLLATPSKRSDQNIPLVP